MQKSLILIPLLAGLLLGGCVHKIDIAQGNVFDRQQLARIELGMTPEQVQFVMGTPMLVDPFHPEQWYYLSSLAVDGGTPKSYRVMIQFAGGRVADIQERGEIPESLVQERLD